jgi:nucleotide-binding universal stress UspA family protein
MNPWLILSAVLALALVAVVVPVALEAFREWRRPWRLTCPRTGLLAQIRVATVHAALAEVVGRQPAIERCSLWPPLAGCRDECLALPRAARLPMRRGEALPRQSADPGIRTIVVPLDGGPGAETVLASAAEIARGCRATLRLLRVLPPAKEVRDEDDRVVAWVDQETERVECEAREDLARLAAGLEGIRVECVVRFGDPDAQLVEESETAGADLIVLAARSRGPLGRWRATGMTRRLQQATTIPLLVVPCRETAAA